MTIVGNSITVADVVADPRYSYLKADKVSTNCKVLSSYTLEQQDLHQTDALKLVNMMKEEFGNGVNCVVCIII